MTAAVQAKPYKREKYFNPSETELHRTGDAKKPIQAKVAPQDEFVYVAAPAFLGITVTQSWLDDLRKLASVAGYNWVGNRIDQPWDFGTALKKSRLGFKSPRDSEMLVRLINATSELNETVVFTKVITNQQCVASASHGSAKR